MGGGPQAASVAKLQQAYMANPTPEMRRTLLWLYSQRAL